MGQQLRIFSQLMVVRGITIQMELLRKILLTEKISRNNAAVDFKWIHPQ